MKKIFKKWKLVFILGVLLLLFSFAVRLYNLTLLPVFADEAIYIRWAQVMGAEPTLRFLPLSDGKQPLFMWVLMFVVRRFSDPLFISRLLSVFCGLGTIAGIFTVSYILFKSKKASLLSSLVWAISPFSFFFDRMALVDSMLAFFGVWTMVFSILTVKLKRLDTAMIAGFCLGFSLLTKSPAIFFVILLPVTWLLGDWSRNRKKIVKNIFVSFGLTSVTLVIGYGLYNILRLGPNFNLITSRNQDYVFPISHAWTNFKDPFIFHIKEIFSDWFIRMGPWPILILAVLGIIATSRKYIREKFVLIAWFFLPILIQSEYAKVFTVRYILFTLPPVFILVSLGVLNKKFKPLFVVLFVLFVGTALYFDYKLVTKPEEANLPSSERSGYLEEWTAGQGIREVSEYIKNVYNSDQNKQIVVGTEGYFGTLPDGLQIYLNNYPKIVVIGTGLDFRDTPQSLKDSKKAGNKTYLVVNSSRFAYKGDPLVIGLKLIASYPKAERREHLSREYVKYGSQESLLFFEVVAP